VLFDEHALSLIALARTAEATISSRLELVSTLRPRSRISDLHPSQEWRFKVLRQSQWLPDCLAVRGRKRC
jgi:hypothetical protein